jgi:hypothetical protein
MKARILFVGGAVTVCLVVCVMTLSSPRRADASVLGNLHAGMLDLTCPYVCQANWVMCGSYTPATPSCTLEDRTETCPKCDGLIPYKRCPTQMQEVVASPQLSAACPDRGLGQGLCYIHVQAPLICYSFQRKYCGSTPVVIGHYCRPGIDLVPTHFVTGDATCVTGGNRGDVETHGSVLACD